MFIRWEGEVAILHYEGPAEGLGFAGAKACIPFGHKGKGFEVQALLLGCASRESQKRKNGEIKARDNDLLRANNAVSQPAMKSTLQKIRAEESSQVVGTSREWHR
jgi:hypothetical protein|uniref:Uncharacterized protein n=1 Tax=Eutreptiella gymnastica TaxID=73025 RepID=A0A7S4GB46_9EUGL